MQRVRVMLVLSLLLLTFLIITTGNTLNAQEEADPIYLPLIFKSFDPSQPYHHLNVRKTVWPSPVLAGELLTYTIRYYVGGNEPAPGLTLVDTLPHSSTFQSCAGGLTCGELAGHVSWRLGDVTPYATGLATLTVQADRSIISGTALYNIATLSDTAGLTTTTTISTSVHEPKRDIALVFDISGSMQYDTVCHGCYEQFGDGNSDRPELPWQNLNYGYNYPIHDTIADYPHTFIHPIPTDHLPRDAFDGTNNGGIGNNEPGEASDGLCYGRDDNEIGYVTLVGGGDPRYFIVIEAELNTRNNSSYETALRQPGQGYWAVQHATYRTVDRMFSTSPGDERYLTGATPALPGEYERGSWMSHHPFMFIAREAIGEPGDPAYLPEVPFGANYDLNDARANISPSLDYEFITNADEGDGGWDGRDDSEGTHVYARIQGGDVYWAVYSTPPGPGADPFDPPPLGSGDVERDTEATAGDPQYGGAQASQWRWIELTEQFSNELNLEAGHKYTLRIWAGQAGLDIDQIVIANTTDRTFFGTSTDYDDGLTYPDNPLLHATAGSAFGQACNRCNPIYGQTIDDPVDCLPPYDNGANQVSERYYDEVAGYYDMRKDEIFGGYQTLRGLKEAVKRYVGNLDPALDQIGLVGYGSSTAADQTLDLRCLQSDPGACHTGSTPVTHTAVLNLLEKYPARGTTNIAQGMGDGLYLLGVPADDPDRPATMPELPANCTGISCARWASAKRMMIVITDGVPNQFPYGTSCDANPNLFLPDLDTLPNLNADRINRGRDCVMYYAHIAAANSIPVYTISLGHAADTDLLQAAADVTAHLDGHYLAAITPDDLDAVFEAIK